MKKIIGSLLALTLLLLPVLPLAGYAAEDAPNTGSCGEGLTWTYQNHTLTISGSGDMDDGCPWERYQDDIRTLVLTDGVSSVGAESFYGCEKLKSIDFGDSLREIGAKAFYDCDRITQVRLPETFRIFGAQCFRDCDSLTKVYCDGNMPRFNDSCLWNGNYVTVYHSLSHPWPEESVSVLLNNFGGRLSVIAANPDVLDEGEEEEEETQTDDEPDDLDELLEKYADATLPPTEAATEEAPLPATEETVPPTTVPPTTVPPTTEPPVTVPPTTQPPTVPTTVATWEPTVPPSTQSVPERDVGGDGWIGLALVGGVLTFLLVGILIYRGVSHRNGRYE